VGLQFLKYFEGIDMMKTPQLNYDRIELGSAVPLNSPLVVYMETTTYCNLECKFCPHYLSPNEFQKGTMSFELFQKVCINLSRFTPQIKLLRFCGLGDSLFNKDIAKFVEFAVKNKVAQRYEMISNGILLSENNQNILSKYLDRLIISIEGLDNKEYLDFTNRKVDFESLVGKIKSFYNIPNRHARLHVKIHNSSVNSEEKIQKFHDIFSDISDEIYVENLINLWPNLISNLGINSGHRFVEDDPVNQKVCSQIFKSLQINHDGKVMPCCIDWKVENVMGDANHEDIIDIWNGKKIRELQIKHLLGKRTSFLPCSSCTMNELSDIDNIDNKASEILERVRAKYERL
jgi:radical SAM protein with 4Fe4S-binding SPASM domain